MNPYSYERNKVQAELTVRQEKGKWRRYAVQFPPTYSTPNLKDSAVVGEYYEPRIASGAPLAILIHGIGDSSVIPCRLLARTLVGTGVACFILYLVFHSSRLPESMKNRILALSAEEWFEAYQLSVINVCQVMDWAASRKELDPRETAVFGISFGGFVSAITMGIDDRIKAGVFVLAGGNGEKMAKLSNPNRYRSYSRGDSEYQEIQESYSRYLSEVAENGFENAIPARKSFLTDPMTFAAYLRGRPLLMINARHDEYIPRETALDFWEACGRPPIKWFPTGHATLWLLYPLVKHHVVNFLRSHLRVPGKS